MPSDEITEAQLAKAAELRQCGKELFKEYCISAPNNLSLTLKAMLCNMIYVDERTTRSLLAKQIKSAAATLTEYRENLKKILRSQLKANIKDINTIK